MPPADSSARRVSSESTLVVPSQMESTCASRRSVGIPVSSTYPAPPNASTTSLATATAWRAVVSLASGRQHAEQRAAGVVQLPRLLRAQQLRHAKGKVQRAHPLRAQSGQRVRVQRLLRQRARRTRSAARA